MTRTRQARPKPAPEIEHYKNHQITHSVTRTHLRAMFHAQTSGHELNPLQLDELWGRWTQALIEVALHDEDLLWYITDDTATAPTHDAFDVTPEIVTSVLVSVVTRVNFDHLAHDFLVELEGRKVEVSKVEEIETA